MYAVGKSLGFVLLRMRSSGRIYGAAVTYSDFILERSLAALWRMD